ncbi:hypothetical protein [uncultured Prevotella sp.]|uniref:hypothetical protein n=1 Tax=uncultured Prevotella sp. TaxID=159272 RepID=UPI00258ADD6C|nr:hypothetical protein [uncultured Prevotella sp.]
MKKLNTNHQVVRRLLERFPRGSTWMRMFLMLMIMMMSSAFAMAQETYGIKVAGEDVTSNNCDNLTEISGVNGTVYFDPNTRTLTLDNATIETEGNNAILNETCKDLVIKLIGTNTIDVKEKAAIVLQEKTTIMGASGSKFTVLCNKAAVLFDSCPLEISSCWLKAYGQYGITGYANNAEEMLTIRNSYVEAMGPEGSICDLAGVKLEGCFFYKPYYASYDASTRSVAVGGSTVTETIEIEPDTYGIMIAGSKSVTSLNCNDLSILEGVEGMVSYNDETKTLTMKDATIKTSFGRGYGIWSNQKDLKIEVFGNNSITMTDDCIRIPYGATIRGSGTLSLKSTDYCGIIYGSSLTVEGVKLYTEGHLGITGYYGTNEETLTVRNAYVEATGNNGSICNLLDLVLDGCSIIQPEDAAFDANVHGVALNGIVVQSKVVIEPSYGIKIAGKEVTRYNCKDLSVIEGVSGTVSFDAATKTLTLDNATIVSTKEPAIQNNHCEGLVIKVLGKNDITATKAVGVKVVRPTTVSGIGGSSLLNVKAGYSAMYMTSTPLTIQDCEVTAVGTYGISGYGINNDVLTIRNSRVKAKGCEGDLNDYEEYGSITDLNDLVLEGCHFHLPGDARFNDELGRVVDGSGGSITTDTVVIEPDSYGIWVADKEVTTLNHKDLSGIDGVEGKLSYNPATNTLTMEDVTITRTDIYNGIRNSYQKDLKIKVVGNNSITTSFSCIFLTHASTISGSGTLSLKSTKGCGIFFNSSLIVEDIKLYVEEHMGISGSYENKYDMLAIRNAYVEATGYNGSIFDIDNLVLDGCSIIQPEGAAFDANVHAVALNGEVVTDKVVIAPDNLGFEIAGEKVTRKNCKDLSVIKGVSGNVSYDPNTKTLTLDNATITNEDEGYGKGIVNKNISDFTIRLIGENTVTTGSASLVLNQPSTITGEGSLSLSSQKYCGLDMEAASVLIDNTKLFVRGAYGIAGYMGAETEVLTVRNSYVEAEGFAAGSIVFLSDLILEDCAITQPDGAEFDAQKKAVVLNGEEIKSKVVIEPVTNGISDITTGVPAHAKGIYSVTGVKQTQQWNELPAGIYIVDGVKRVKR